MLYDGKAINDLNFPKHSWRVWKVGGLLSSLHRCFWQMAVLMWLADKDTANWVPPCFSFWTGFLLGLWVRGAQSFLRMFVEGRLKCSCAAKHAGGLNWIDISSYFEEHQKFKSTSTNKTHSRHAVLHLHQKGLNAGTSTLAINWVNKVQMEHFNNVTCMA